MNRHSSNKKWSSFLEEKAEKPRFSMPEPEKPTKRRAIPFPPKTRELTPLETPLNHELRKMFQDIRNKDLAAAATCRHPNCSFTSTKGDVIEHEKDCILAIVPCVWCNEKVPFDCIEDHWKVT